MAGGLLFQWQEQSHERQILELGDGRCGGDGIDAAVNRHGSAQPFGSSTRRLGPRAGTSGSRPGTGGSSPGTSSRVGTCGFRRFFRF